jgi:hypothetical protein
MGLTMQELHQNFNQVERESVRYMTVVGAGGKGAIAQEVLLDCE